jgi:predicted MFS family arabinose efflux permease
MLYVLPVYLADLGSRTGLNEAQLGTIAATENVGIGLASVLGVLWFALVNRRAMVILAGCACALLNIGALFAHSFQALVAYRFLNGLAGEGVLFALAFQVLGATRNPGRSFGIALTSVVAAGSVILAASPYLNRASLGGGSLLPLILLCAVIPFAGRWMPEGRAPTSSVVPGKGLVSWSGRAALLSLLAMGVWFAAPGAFWTFAEDAAETHGISGAMVATALAVGNVVGLLGSLAAAWQGERWGRSYPILGATGGLCLFVVSFAHSASFLPLTVALCGFNICWNYAAVFQMAQVVTLDVTGRLSVGIAAAQVFGFAGGGFISGLMIYRIGFGVLTSLVALCAVVGLVLFVPGLRQGMAGSDSCSPQD